jgi:hypothetical protein
MNIKLFENFGEDPEFTQKISSDDVYLSLYSEPYSLRSGYVIGGSVSWKCEMSYKKWGIEMESIRLTKLSFEIEVEDEDNEDETHIKEIVVPSEALQDTSRIKYEVEGFPLTIASLEITMRNSEDPEDWKYEITLGKKDN